MLQYCENVNKRERRSGHMTGQFGIVTKVQEDWKGNSNSFSHAQKSTSQTAREYRMELSFTSSCS